MYCGADENQLDNTDLQQHLSPLDIGAVGSINIKSLSVEDEIALEILLVHDLLLGSRNKLRNSHDRFCSSPCLPNPNISISKRTLQGYWIARDCHGLAGGTFLTRKDALCFALFESGATAPASTLTRRHKPLAMPNGVTPGQGNYLERRSPECRIAVPRRTLADPRRAVTRKECGTRAAGR
jgi:hypothetical protein